MLEKKGGNQKNNVVLAKRKKKKTFEIVWHIVFTFDLLFKFSSMLLDMNLFVHVFVCVACVMWTDVYMCVWDRICTFIYNIESLLSLINGKVISWSLKRVSIYNIHMTWRSNRRKNRYDFDCWWAFPFDLCLLFGVSTLTKRAHHLKLTTVFGISFKTF